RVGKAAARFPGMDHRDDIDSKTLARYLSGELGPTEAAQVERWIAADPAHRELADSLRKIWSPRELPEFDPDDLLWRRIAAGVERPLPKPALVESRQTRAWPFRTPARDRKSTTSELQSR